MKPEYYQLFRLPCHNYLICWQNMPHHLCLSKKKNYLRSHNPMILFGKKTVRPLPENDITRSINNSKNTSYMTIPIWGRYSKISITDVGKDLVSRMYIGTVFIHNDIVNTKCPILRNWLTKIWDVPTEEDLQSWQRWRECTMT